MTQLGELRDAYQKFVDAGVRLYAVSYDDVDALAAFATANRIPFPLLSDSDSSVIRQYGILNTLIPPGEAPFYGIPFPGTYVVDESGVVVEKYFPRHIANRESPESVLESAIGSLLLGDDEPHTSGGDEEVHVTAFFHGGGGSLKSGILRKVIVRFELAEGLHIYDEPVPPGMVATSVEVTGPEGLVVGAPSLPPTEPLKLAEIGITLNVWSGNVDIAVPVWANSKLVNALADDQPNRVRIEVTVRYQACNDRTCLLPATQKLTLEVPIDPLDAPNIGGLGLENQRVTKMDSATHLMKLIERFR